MRLSTLRDEKAHRAWYQLGNVSGELDEIERGEVELCFRWCHDKARAFQLPREFTAGEKPADAKKAPNELHVYLARARDLEIMDKSVLTGKGSSDPVATLDVAGETKKSAIKKKALNPVWTESFSWAVEDEAAIFELTVEDHDPLSGNDFMGRCAVPLKTLGNRKIHRGWHRLIGPKEADGKKRRQAAKGGGGGGGEETAARRRGRVDLALRWVHNPKLVVPLPCELEASELHFDRPANELQVFLVRGAGLKVMDKNLFSKGGSLRAARRTRPASIRANLDVRQNAAETLRSTRAPRAKQNASRRVGTPRRSSDPVVRFDCCGENEHSTVKKKSLNPEWAEYFALPVEELDAVLLITVSRPARGTPSFESTRASLRIAATPRVFEVHRDDAAGLRIATTPRVFGADRGALLGISTERAERPLTIERKGSPDGPGPSVDVLLRFGDVRGRPARSGRVRAGRGPGRRVGQRLHGRGPGPGRGWNGAFEMGARVDLGTRDVSGVLSSCVSSGSSRAAAASAASAVALASSVRPGRGSPRRSGSR